MQKIVLVGIEGVLKGKKIPLVLDQKEWIIGRDPEKCTLVVEDPKVSRKHIKISLQEEQFVLEPLTPANPVSVNGDKIQGTVTFQEGDKVSLGDTVFMLVQDEPQESWDFNVGEPRYLLKVVSGPNIGAECAVDLGATYTVGSDETTCDIIFQDISVSPQHARVTFLEDGCEVEDLKSAQGVEVDQVLIQGKVKVPIGGVIKCGTTSFMMVDREQEVILPSYAAAPQADVIIESQATHKKKGKAFLVVCSAVFTVLIVAMFSLLHTTHQEIEVGSDQAHLDQVLHKFPAVKASYLPSMKKLVLFGHVSSANERNELSFLLQEITSIQLIDDYVVNDEAVWQETNELLSKNPDFRGVAIHSPAPGSFVLTGYLHSVKQGVSLTEYMNLNFNYLDRLQNLVYIEELLLQEIQTVLRQANLQTVEAHFNAGELLLTGYVPTTHLEQLETALNYFQQLSGVRLIKDFVIGLTPEQAVVNLNEKFPGKYHVTGISKYGSVNINVVINGQMVTRGDIFDGMKVVSIQPDAVFLEKDGLKYKLELTK